MGPSGLPALRRSRIPLPVPLRSTPVTALPRYYEHSDSCAAALRRDAHEHRPPRTGLPTSRHLIARDHSVSTHPWLLLVALPRYPSARGMPGGSPGRLRQCWADSPRPSGRIEFVILRTSHSLQVLPTLPRGNAVPVGYGPESVCPGRTCTSQMKCACGRTQRLASLGAAGQRPLAAWISILRWLLRTHCPSKQPDATKHRRERSERWQAAGVGSPRRAPGVGPRRAN